MGWEFFQKLVIADRVAIYVTDIYNNYPSRPGGLVHALQMLRHSFSHPDFLSLLDPDSFFGLNSLPLSEKSFFVMLGGILILMLVDYLKKRKVDLKTVLARQNIAFRWLVYYVLIFAVLIFGVYGPEYEVSEFLYLQF